MILSSKFFTSHFQKHLKIKEEKIHIKKEITLHEHLQYVLRCPSFSTRIKQTQQFQFDFKVSPEKMKRVRWELAVR